MAKKVVITLFVISIWMLTSSAFSANVTTLLERGIYAEETKGDLDEAISIYQKIIDENTGNSANIAEAYYRLGTCYLKTGDETKAIEMFKELLAGFREHKEIAVDARAQLLKLNALDEKKEEQISKPFDLGPVPWESGEICWYDLIVKNDPEPGVKLKAFDFIKEVSIDGNDLWRLESYFYIKGGTPVISYYCVDVLKESFTPVSTIENSIEGVDYKTIYKKEKDQIRVISNGKEKKLIPVGNSVFDVVQIPRILRLLPLAENYSTSLNTIVSQTGQIVNLNVTVTGKEAVTVPAGTFECYCLKCVEEFEAPYKMWVSTDDKKYLVKMDSSTNELEGVTFELEKVIHITGGMKTDFDSIIQNFELNKK